MMRVDPLVVAALSDLGRGLRALSGPAVFPIEFRCAEKHFTTDADYDPRSWAVKETDDRRPTAIFSDLWHT